jgi:hypothetical protein
VSPQQINDRVANALIRHIEPIFKPGVKLTLIARTPGMPEADCLVTIETDLQELTAFIERSKSREPVKS